VILLTVENFKARLIRFSHPDALRIAVDVIDKNQLYIIVNGGIANINCEPIELYATEIKIFVLEMITQGELYLNADEKPLRIGQDRSAYYYVLKADEYLPQGKTSDRSFYFFSLFIRWQRTHELSDKKAQKSSD